MSLKLTYYGQNDSVNATPAVALIGDPGTDQQTLTSGGYLGGVIVALTSTLVGYTGSAYSGYAIQSTNEPAFGAIGNIVPCDADGSAGNIPFATLLNGPGEFAGAIGPSGSRKAPVVRALWQGNVDSQGYDASATFTVGQYVYCGGHTHSNTGLYTSSARAGSVGTAAVGICTHVFTASEPWLGVASLL
jgi:hypothetical protein